MKIGVLAHHLDTRKDLCDLLDLLSRNHEVVVYLHESKAQKISELLPVLTIIPIPLLTGITRIFQLIFQYTYIVFGKLPASSYNYYLTERIKLLNSNYKKWSKFIQSYLLLLSKVSPKIISYDRYLDLILRFKKSFTIDADVDIFLCFTEISDDWIFAKIIQENKPVWTYVYSWDHPCKMKTFSKRANYLVWNNEIKADLIKLQHIKAEKIQIWGSTQFATIEQFFKSEKTDMENNPYDFSYIYLGCATGYDALASQEVKYCYQIADLLKSILPNWKLVIRPYPFQKNKDIYKSLTTLSNVVFDECESSNEKFVRIKNAKAFFHFGTTMGYEAIYFDTPSFLIDMADPKKDAFLYGFVHQYQNDKYLNATDSLVIKSGNELINIFQNLTREQPGVYLNPKIGLSTPLRSLPVLMEELFSLMNTHNTTLLAS